MSSKPENIKDTTELEKAIKDVFENGTVIFNKKTREIELNPSFEIIGNYQEAIDDGALIFNEKTRKFEINPGLEILDNLPAS